MTHSKKDSGRRERKRRARMDELLETAMALVGADGIDSFSMHKLADAMDLTVGAIYRYFPSKSALIAALEQRVIEALEADLSEADKLVRSRDDLREDEPLVLLLTLGGVYHRRFTSHPQQMRLIGGLLTSPDPVLRPDEADAVIKSMLAAMQIVCAAFENATDRGVLREGDPLERAILVWAALRGVEQTAKLGRHRPSLFVVSRLYRSLLDTLLLGWGADPERLEQAWTHIETESEVER